jgi:CDP-diglyceride synthetase
MTQSNKTPPSSKSQLWSDLPRRLLTVAIGFPLVWKILSHQKTAWFFFAGAHLLASWEWVLLEENTSSSGTQTRQTQQASSSFGMRLVFCIGSLCLACITQDSLFHLALCITTGCLVWIQHRHHWILGMVLLVVPFRTWYLISQDFPSSISLLSVVWNCDNGALVVGRISKVFLGNHRMPMPAWIHKISPAKSVEGFMGGMLGGVLTTLYLVPWLARNVLEPSEVFEKVWIDAPFTQRLAMAFALSLLAIVGDLVESAVKRQSQAKDSGSMLPGHGGILDRFDSSLLSVLLYHHVLLSYY